MNTINIIDEHISSAFNGVGTYLSSLLSCIKDCTVHINVLSYNENVEDFTIEEKGDYSLYKIPQYAGLFLDNGLPSLALLGIYIHDGLNNAFIVSHSPCHNYLRQIKKMFPKSKTVCVIHDQGWTTPFLGNMNRFIEIATQKRLYGKDKIMFEPVKEYTKWEKSMYKLCNRIVCLSHSTYELLTNYYSVPKEKISLIPNGIEIKESTSYNHAKKNLIRRQLGIDDDEIILLFVGRAVKAKGIFELLDAFEKLWIKNKKLRLIVAGYTINLQEYICHIPQSALHVSFLGSVGKDIIYNLYSSADIGIISSYTEQCSYTALEMMAHKLPIISTDGHGLTDVFDNMKNAIVVRADESILSTEIETSILKLINMPAKERIKMANNAYNDVRARFSLDNMGKGYINMMTQLFNEDSSIK